MMFADSWVLDFKFNSPPTPRIHTPEPSEFAGAFPGALTKAVLWVRNAVLAAWTAPLTAFAAESPDAITAVVPDIVFGPDVSVSGAQLCAIAPDEPSSPNAATAPATNPQGPMRVCLKSKTR